MQDKIKPLIIMSIALILIFNPLVYPLSVNNPGISTPPDDDAPVTPEITAAARGVQRAAQSTLGEIVSGVGTENSEMFGWNLSSLGDLNSDGIRELLVGAPGNDNSGTDAGAVYLFYSYPDMGQNDIDAASANVTIYGGAAGDNFGWDLSCIGDFDRDGYEDLLVGAPGNYGNTGKAYVFNSNTISGAGDPGTLDVNDAELNLSGEDFGDRFGQAVGWLGNITDGPQHDDIIIGAPYAGTTIPAIIIDDGDPGYHEVGNWSTWSGASQFYNTDVRYPSLAGGAGANISYWTPDLPAGYFEVYAWWDDLPTYAPDAPYTINFKPAGFYEVPAVGAYVTGVDTANASLGWVIIDLDQTDAAYDGIWNYLGTYEFAKGTSGNVSLSDDVASPADVVVADAVCFVDASSSNDDGKIYVHDGSSARRNMVYSISMGENPYDNYGASVGALRGLELTATDKINDVIIGAPGADRAYVWYEGNLPGFYIDLWEVAEDDPPPLDFTNGFYNYTNTFGLGMGDDGWDWQQGVYGTLSDPAAQALCNWVADPGAGNNALDSDPCIRVKIGGHGLSWSGTIDAGGDNFESAAFGVEFTITEKMYTSLLQGYSAYLSFEYAAIDPFGTGETEEEVMVYARFDGTYLGTDQGGDGRREVDYYANDFHTTEDNSFKSFEDDVSVLIIGPGQHYIDMGAAINSWTTMNEGCEVYFDNIKFELRKTKSFDLILNGDTNTGFGCDVAGGGDIDNDGNDRDIIVGAPNTPQGNAYIFYGSNWQSETYLNVTSGEMDLNLTGENGNDSFGFAVASAGDIDNNNYKDILVGAPGADTVNGIDSGMVYVFRANGIMSATSSAADADNIGLGESAADRFGYAVCKVDSLNGDPYNEIFVGAPWFGPGNSGKTYVLGRLAPTIQLQYPLGGETIDRSITLSASVTDPNADIDPVGVRFYYSVDQVDWILINSAATPSSGSIYEVQWDTSMLVDGASYYIKANVTDLDLNLAEDISTAFTIDNLFPPSALILNPYRNDIVQGMLTINATGKDSQLDLLGGGINDTRGMVFYYSDDNVTWNLLDTDYAPTIDNIYEITWDSAEVIDGEYWVKVNITDLDNISAEDLVKFEVDNPSVAPVVNLIYPDELVDEVSGVITLNATAFDRDNDINSTGVSYYYSADELNWVFIDNDPIPATGRVYDITWDTTTVNDGWYWVKAFATDTTDLSNFSTSPRFKIHNSMMNAPNLKVTYPNNGEEVRLNVRLEADGFDIDNNLDTLGVRFYYSSDRTNWMYIDNKPTPVDPAGNHFVYIWDTLTTPDGRYWLNVSASDTTNLTGWDHSDKPFFIHNTQLNPPILDVIYPNGGEILTGNVMLSAAAGDLENNIDENGVSFYYSRDKLNWTEVGNVVNWTSEYSIPNFYYYNISWDTTTVADGEYWVKVTATDTHNLNSEDLSDGAFYIHNGELNPPIVTVVFPNGGEVLNGTVTLEVTAFDLEANIDTSGVKFYYSEDDNASWTLLDSVSGPSSANDKLYELTWNTTTVPDGIYWLRANATDLTAQEGFDLSDGSFIIHNNENNPPKVKIIHPTEGETVKGTIEIRVEATDLENNVEEVQVYYSTDNENWVLIGTATSPTEPGGNIYSISWNTADVYDGEYWLKAVVIDSNMSLGEAYSDGGFSVENGIEAPVKDDSDDLMAGLWWLWILLVIIIIILCLLIVVWGAKRRKKEEEALKAMGVPTTSEATAVLREISGPAVVGDKAEQKVLRAAPEGPEPVTQTLVTDYRGDLGAKVSEDLARNLETWRQEGIDISKMEHLMKADPDAVFMEFAMFKANVALLSELKARFNALDTKWFEEEDKSIRSKIKNPDLAVAVEREITELEKKIEAKPKIRPAKAEESETDLGVLPEEGEDAKNEDDELAELEQEGEALAAEDEEELKTADEELEEELKQADKDIEAADEEFEEEKESEDDDEDKNENQDDPEDFEEFLPDTVAEEGTGEPEDKD